MITQVRVLPNIAVKKVASGADHMALLTQDGAVFTLGNSEQGQLGRVPEMFAHRGGRRGGHNPRFKNKKMGDSEGGGSQPREADLDCLYVVKCGLNFVCKAAENRQSQICCPDFVSHLRCRHKT
jgi:alpha-tubulin suppressor-like RCC1 family protein